MEYVKFWKEKNLSFSVKRPSRSAMCTCTTCTKLTYQMLSSVSRRWTSLLNRIKCSSLSVISWLGVGVKEKWRENPHHLQKSKNPPKRKIKNKKWMIREVMRQKKEMRMERKRQFSQKKKKRRKNQYSILSLKMQILMSVSLSLLTATSKKSKIEFWVFRRRMWRCLWFAQELYMVVEKIPSTLYSELPGYRIQILYLLSGEEKMWFQPFIWRIWWGSWWRWLKTLLRVHHIFLLLMKLKTNSWNQSSKGFQ